MIGSGIFSTPGKVLRDVGAPGTAMLLWALGGLVSLVGTFAYMELGCAIPKSGGEQAYLDEAFRRPRALVAFLFCWCMIICMRPGSAAADSIIFGEFLLHAGTAHPSPWAARGLGILCITSITLLNVLSVKWAVRIHDGLTVVKLVVLTLIAVTGMIVGAGWTRIEPSHNFRNAWAGTSSNAGDYAQAMFRIFWCYDGWNNLNYAVGELRNPTKNLPKAAGLGVSIVTTLYVLANLSYFLVVPTSEMLGSGNLVASVFFDRVFGPTMGSKVLPIFIAFSGYGAVCAMVFSSSRVIVAASQANILPMSNYFKEVHPRLHTPIRALCFNWAITMVLMLAPPPGAAFDFLISMVGFPTWFFYGVSIVGLILMRWTRPELHRPIKIFIPAAVFFIAISVFLTIFPFVPTEAEYPYWAPPVLGTVFILTGIPLWWFFVRGNDVTMDFDLH
ncbi:hypothetical protein CXG81DRAFT_10307 [Caulochytrium protostelioides]|uniref:Amino acid transporter n=1 Tax=Caulochytrium protostelioides TaxID=1555241 RepID=A0A4P9XBR4_9FUNG|nr:amino acid transporter [Caulochytrium protostelioides]RKP02848.1 hypothetical protein CXG81DRAFT_10307 [Caulochytrium protostelioides]|eukprot:RKP02848.1 hypothetical protein CXG81DRAFT_10307 [Caulochytrium protostelioides]